MGIRHLFLKALFDIQLCVPLIRTTGERRGPTHMKNKDSRKAQVGSKRKDQIFPSGDIKEGFLSILPRLYDGCHFITQEVWNLLDSQGWEGDDIRKAWEIM